MLIRCLFWNPGKTKNRQYLVALGHSQINSRNLEVGCKEIPRHQEQIWWNKNQNHQNVQQSPWKTPRQGYGSGRSKPFDEFKGGLSKRRERLELPWGQSRDSTRASIDDNRIIVRRASCWDFQLPTLRTNKGRYITIFHFQIS